ncbi:MAG: hypothetical protein PF487_02955, partial [Bacteroidales bacterium]|nr:hypothetical protein [Bacteroidales bacterium]
PKFCMNPKYLLVSMEPSKKPEEKLPKGILNFLNSIDDFILHYCAFYYLCGGNFDYNITDISKGAMPVEIARKLPGRYEDWFNLLKDEIEIYNNPKIIAIGKSEAGMFLKNKDLVEDKNILYHFSNGGVRVHVQNYYNKNLKEKYPLDSAPTMKELSEFTKKILNYNDYFLNEDKILNKMSRELHDQEKMLFLYYKSKFLEIKNNYIISRQDL